VRAHSSVSHAEGCAGYFIRTYFYKSNPFVNFIYPRRLTLAVTRNLQRVARKVSPLLGIDQLLESLISNPVQCVPSLFFVNIDERVGRFPARCRILIPFVRDHERKISRSNGVAIFRRSAAVAAYIWPNTKRTDDIASPHLSSVAAFRKSSHSLRFRPRSDEISDRLALPCSCIRREEAFRFAKTRLLKTATRPMVPNRKRSFGMPNAPAISRYALVIVVRFPRERLKTRA